MTDMSAVANEVFENLRQFNYTVTFYDSRLAKVMEAADARNFFANIDVKRQDDKQESAPKSPQLMVTLKDEDADSSIQLLYAKSVKVESIYGLMATLRVTATKYNMTFDPRQHFKEIDPKDPEISALAESDSRGYSMQVTEGMYGTSKSSYLRCDKAKMIVRHKARVDDSQIGARGRFVEAIFIQNDLGERLLFPTRDLAAARAMTQHVSSGGRFHDDLGGQILQMADEYGNLGVCSRYVQANVATLPTGAQVVREACRARMVELRKIFHRLFRPRTYATEGAALMANARLLNETGGAVDEARIDELRVLLNDADFSPAVYECAHKAMLAAHPNKPVTERAISRTRRTKDLPLAENHPTVQAHLRWLDSFRLNAERGLFEFAQSDDHEYDDHYESGLQEADDNFDAKDFVHSPQMQEVIGGRDPHADDENVLDEDEVIDALQDYLRQQSSITDVDGDLLTLAERVFDRACVALNDLGFEVETHQPMAEMDAPGDLMAEDLTREDILLPSNSPRPGDTLFRQVGKAAEKTRNGYRPLGKKDVAKTTAQGGSQTL
jgi:hypothetical protein